LIFFFDNRLNGETYLSFLQNKLPEFLEVDFTTQQKMWWQQDGTPSHSHRIGKTSIISSMKDG